MAKRPTIALPPVKVLPATPDQFVAAGQPDLMPEPSKVKPKRLTIDVPPELHHRFKVASVSAGKDMKDIMTDLIEQYVAGER